MDYSSASSLRTGSFLKGSAYTYHIEKVLGQGSFGITYLATIRISVPGPLGSLQTELKVAVKEFYMREFSMRHEDGTITEMTEGTLVANYAKKFRREAENLSGLSHPNIVKVLEVFEANNTCYYSMEYIEGGSLNAYIMQKGGFPESEAIDFIVQIGQALSHMHTHNMLHLDVKPQNVMCDATRTKAVLIDFGLSKQYQANGCPESSTTIGLGTPGYAPLEQVNTGNSKDFSPTLDVYALGATLFKLLTGETPPNASDVLDEGLPLALLKNKGVSEVTILAIKAAMEPRKSMRLKSVESFVSILHSENDKSNWQDAEMSCNLMEKQHQDTEETVISRAPAHPHVSSASQSIRTQSSNTSFKYDNLSTVGKVIHCVNIGFCCLACMFSGIEISRLISGLAADPYSPVMMVASLLALWGYIRLFRNRGKGTATLLIIIGEFVAVIISGKDPDHLVAGWALILIASILIIPELIVICSNK